VSRPFRRARASKVLLAAVGALAALSLLPGAAAAMDQNRPLILVHGHEHDSGVSCNGTWRDLMAHYRIYGYKGPFDAVQYYKNDTACSTYYGAGSAPEIMNADSDTDIRSIAKALAWHIYNKWNLQGTGVNIVAHSMGGLVVRYMIDSVQRHRAGFPPHIVAPSVVTLGTPHNGIEGARVGCYFGNNDDQCFEMDKSSSFIEYLRNYAQNPQGAFGTWWSLGGSHADNTVDEGSATSMSVKYKIHWASDTNIEHSDYMHEKLGDNPWDYAESITAHCYSTSTGGSFVEGRCYWPIQWSYVIIAYYGY
jgi:Palmitoyl protein thioesterase